MFWLENYEPDVEDENINNYPYHLCVEKVIECIEKEFIAKYLYCAGKWRFNAAEISLYTRVIDFRSINISRIERQIFLDMHQCAVDKLVSVDPPDRVWFQGNWLTIPPDLRPIFYELVQRVIIDFHLERIEFIRRLNR